MNPLTTTTCSPVMVDQIFRSLLQNNPRSDNVRMTTSETRPPLTSPPAKNTIRFIENDQNNRREKYDGYRWRLVCTWNIYDCTNLAGTRQLCGKHNAMQRHKEVPKKKRPPLLTTISLPVGNHLGNLYNQKNMLHQKENPAYSDDDDIQIIEEFCKKPAIRHSTNTHVKLETADFNVFSVDHVDEADTRLNVKPEPTTSSAHRPSSSTDIEYLSSTTRSNGLNISELIAKKIPPLTDFEEEYIASRLMEKFATTCPMLDAQLFLQDEAVNVVKKNYRLKMDAVAPEYFYDFLLRHPRVALHFNNWFLTCKAVPPTTGCPVDTKVWTLSMIVRGALAADRIIDEHDG
ncbi:unnamed protein product [Adineta ricciae]|uniref:Uncharacterized protein n=1 Tax=Adineta ricciae TaxID=249248 RepID=A0A813T1W0_ADIRI|nr:unnamed protein product [Adineta ricciae]CAF1083164.1 unnamed protein product [Adineta ricciae]